MICTVKTTGATDITFKYLDMKKYFTFEKNITCYYFKKEGLRYGINSVELNREVVKLLVEERIVVSFADDLERELRQF